MQNEEGRIDVDGYKVWFRRVGEGGVPLLLLHGGPGAGHDYLETLVGLASNRAVIFYDQLGCGRSDQPADSTLWHIERFVREIDTVRDALCLDRVHILGQSWGGWLAIEYMLGAPRGVESLVLASTSASISQFVDEAQRLIAEMPKSASETIRDHLAAGDYDHPDFEAAVEVFYKRHVCRLDVWPEPLLRTIKNLEAEGGHRVYTTMNGPNEFTVIGNLRAWNRRDRLHEITVPTLITVGRYDEITPACAETMHESIPNSQIAVFEESAHCAHLEEPEAYLATVDKFLARVEAGEL